MLLFTMCLLILQFWWSFSNGSELKLYNSVLFVTEDMLAATSELEVSNNLDNNVIWPNNSWNQVECSKEQVLKVFYDTLNSPHLFYPLAIVSGVCPEAIEAIAMVSKYYCLPVVSYSTSLEFPGSQDMYPHLFSVVPSDHYFAVGTAHFISYYKWQRAIVITQDQYHLKRIKENLLTLLENNNVTMISDIILPSTLSKLDNNNFFPPDVRIFVLNMDSDQAKVVFCMALRLNIEQYNYVWIIPGWYSDRWWNVGENITLEKYTCNSNELSMFIAQQRVIVLSHYPSVINYTSCEVGACFQEYITKTLLHDAKRVVVRGLMQTVMQEEAGGNQSICVNRTDSSFCSPESDDCFNTTLNNIKTMNFYGDSGFIQFDETGSRAPDVVNVFQYRIANKCQVHVAVINLTSTPISIVFVDGDDVLWVGGIPSDGTPRTVEDFIPLWLTVTANVWCALVIICSIVFITFMCIFRKRKLVRLTSPSLNYVIAIGIIMFNIGGMMFIQPQVPFIVLEIFCSARVWFVTIGISFCFVTINVKMWRIYYIFHYPNPSKKKKVFKDWHLFMVVMMCVVLDVIILTITSAVNSARLKPVETDDIRHSTDIDSDGITRNHKVFLCVSRLKLVWLGLLFGYKAIIQMIGLILALKIRNVKIDILNDSKEVALTIYLSSVILAVVVIVSVVLENNLTIYSAVYAYGTALSTTAVLIIAFFTKAHKLYKDPWGEKIFTNDHGTGANALSGTGAGAGTVVTATLASHDDDRVYALEKKLRQVELELRMYKSGDVMNKTSDSYSSGRAESEDNLNLTKQPRTVDILELNTESNTSMQHLKP